MDIVLKIDNFEGPLDLLLHLIEKKKLKISERVIGNDVKNWQTFVKVRKNGYCSKDR